MLTTKEFEQFKVAVECSSSVLIPVPNNQGVMTPKAFVDKDVVFAILQTFHDKNYAGLKNVTTLEKTNDSKS